MRLRSSRTASRLRTVDYRLPRVQRAPVKYELETIPVWDAYRAESECPLCLLLRRAEAEFVQFYVGHSVMVPEMRVQVNDAGFCRVHFPMLLDGGNRLGLALITHTHLGELRNKLTRHLLSGKSGGALKKELARLAVLVDEQLDRCLICDRLRDRFLRYAYTIVHLWHTDPDFRVAFHASRGFCLDHLGGQLEMARDTLPGSRLTTFVADTAELQGRAWDRLEQELLAFTGRFDYRSTGPIGSATKQSVADAIAKLTGANPSEHDNHG